MQYVRAHEKRKSHAGGWTRRNTSGSPNTNANRSRERVLTTHGVFTLSRRRAQKHKQTPVTSTKRSRVTIGYNKIIARDTLDYFVATAGLQTTARDAVTMTSKMCVDPSNFNFHAANSQEGITNYIMNSSRQQIVVHSTNHSRCALQRATRYQATQGGFTKYSPKFKTQWSFKKGLSGRHSPTN